MLQTCAENNVDNIGMFSLLVSRAYTELSTFLLLTTPPRVGWGEQKATPTDQRDIPYDMMLRSTKKAQEEGEEERGYLDFWHLSSQVTITSGGDLLSWR